MGYANSFEYFGIELFITTAKKTGVDGIIIVDYPPEECEFFVQKLRANKLDSIFLLAPTSSEKRMKQIAKYSSGFSYYISLSGITGACNINIHEVAQRVSVIRKYVKLPIGVGFGINNKITAKSISKIADAIIIGSYLIQKLEQTSQNYIIKVTKNFIADIRQSIDN